MGSDVAATRAVIIDYGSGNLRSAAKAFERAAREGGSGAAISVTATPEDLATASHIVLPGVGAFADCMRGLTALPGMVEALNREVRERGKPFLGICVGMQLMAERGLEYGTHAGLGWIKGDVQKLSPSDAALKIPHMGWNELIVDQPRHPVLAGIATQDHAYFVHSYELKARENSDVAAHTQYGGDVVAVVARDNIAGTQFHPEKSQAAGLKLIANFLGWRP
jgi:imidazole glycerol-phosphate synthase subunit HisH